MLVCTLGDLLLDVIVRVDSPLTPGDDTAATTLLAAGGQAANVAVWAAALGAEARVVAKRGGDDAGRLCAEELRGRGVEAVGPIAGRNGVVVSLVAVDGERTMLSDRGVASELRPDEIEPAWLSGCDALHVSGYALLQEPAAAAAAKAAALARAAGARVSVDLSSWTAIRDHGPEQVLARLRSVAPNTIFASDVERETLGGDVGTEWVLKHGAGGITVDGQAYPAVVGEVVDTTGAGDAFAAGFLVGGVELGLETAARCVAIVGALP